MSLVEVLIVLAILTLGLVAAATKLQTSTSTAADNVGSRIVSLTAASATAPDSASEAAPSADSGSDSGHDADVPKPQAKKKSGWSKFVDFLKKAGNFIINNLTPIGDIKTLLDPHASALDKALAGASLFASVIPVPGVGPAVKGATKAAGLAAKAGRGAKGAEHAVEAAKDAKRGGEAVRGAERGGEAPEGAAKRSRPDEEPDCAEGVCRLGPGKNCFAAGTLVFTEQGDRPIESIAQGDRVWSRDPLSGGLALKTVLQTFAHDSYVIDLVTADASHSEHLTVTPNHPFWVEGAGWVEAVSLGETAQLWTPVGALTAHAAASWGERTKVYNLEVADSHTYFVGALHAWVHNQGGSPCPDPKALPDDLEALLADAPKGDASKPLRAGETVSYKESTAAGRGTKGDGLTGDHIPSNASNIQRAQQARYDAEEERLGRALTQQERAKLALTSAEKSQINRNFPTHVKPEDFHTKVSDTYGGRNNAAKIAADAKDPGGAMARTYANELKHLDQTGKLDREQLGGYIQNYKEVLDKLDLPRDPRVEKVLQDYAGKLP
jgi:Tfp pilus assembly protein PilV